MHFCLVPILVSAGASLVASRAVPDSHVLHEKRDVSSPSNMIKRDRLNEATRLPMRIGLKQSNLDQAHDWLMEVSHPEFSKFGQHWSQEDIIEVFRPSDETRDMVMEWLSSAGIASHRITHSDNRQWLAFDASAKEAEDLLHADYHEYEHSNGKLMAGCDEYHIPKYLQEHIDYVTPGIKRSFIKSKNLSKRGFGKPTGGKPFGWHKPTSWPMPHIPGWSPADLATCDVAVTPACIRALYHFSAPNPHAKVSSNNSFGIFEEGSYYSQEDLDLFYTNFTSYIPNGTHPILNSIDGGVAPVPVNEAGGEADLDFQIALPIIYPQTTTLYQVDDEFYALGGSPTATGIFNTFFDALDGSYCTYSAFGETGNDPVLDPTYPDPNGYQGQLQCGVYKPANVISISYGEQESDLPAYYQQRQCNEFLKLGLQGVSIFVASGDTGVSSYPNDPPPNGCLNGGKVFSPTQPNSCPYLTNVGSTTITAGNSVHDPETATTRFPSGGGFSNIFPAPSYQKAALKEYFSQHNPPYPYYFDGNYANATNGGVYNRNGRGIPDVAANGDRIAVYVQGKARLTGGTSASSPLFAALVNRIVEERIKIGKGPLGFINPVLYEHAYVLNDVLNGTNPGCGTSGFSCVKGWDPVTGLGTPNYPKMLELFLRLP